MPDRVTPLPSSSGPTVELVGDEAWLTTLHDPHDTTATAAACESGGLVRVARRKSTPGTHRR